MKKLVCFLTFVLLCSGCNNPVKSLKESVKENHEKPKTETEITFEEKDKSKKDELSDEKKANIKNLSGLTACERGDFNTAIDMFKEAIELDPQARYFNNLGRALYWSNQLRLSLKAYLKAQTLEPDDPELKANIGDVFYQLKKNDKAISFYHDALNLNPKLARAHYQLALIYLDNNDIKNAEARINKVLAVDPGHNNALLKRVIIYHLTNRNIYAWNDVKLLERRGFAIKEDLKKSILIGVEKEKKNNKYTTAD